MGKMLFKIFGFLAVSSKAGPAERLRDSKFQNYSFDLEDCPDKDLFAQCEDDCYTDQFLCMLGCGPSNRDCQKKCTDTFIACDADCPCGANYPNGCEGSPSTYCQTGGGHALVLSHTSTSLPHI